jgi:hypothetical protein
MATRRSGNSVSGCRWRSRRKQKAEREPGSNNVIARLRDRGFDWPGADGDVGDHAAHLDTLHSAEMRGWGAYVKSFMDNAVGPVRGLMSDAAWRSGAGAADCLRQRGESAAGAGCGPGAANWVCA